jgi:hypothetical protein
VVEEKLDDYIAYLSLNSPTADLSEIYRINDAIKSSVEALDKEVSDIAAEFQGLDFKSAAIKLKGHPHFSFVMCLLRGMKNDYLSYYAKNHLVDWSLEQIELGDLSPPVEA